MGCGASSPVPPGVAEPRENDSSEDDDKEDFSLRVARTSTGTLGIRQGGSTTRVIIIKHAPHNFRVDNSFRSRGGRRLGLSYPSMAWLPFHGWTGALCTACIEADDVFPCVVLRRLRCSARSLFATLGE